MKTLENAGMRVKIKYKIWIRGERSAIVYSKLYLICKDFALSFRFPCEHIAFEIPLQLF